MINEDLANQKIDKSREKVQVWGEKIAQYKQWDWHALGHALQLAHEAIENAPGYQRGWTLLADIYHRIGKPSLARKCLEISYKLAKPGPNHPGRFYKQVESNIQSNYPYNAVGKLKRESPPMWFERKYNRYLQTIAFPGDTIPVETGVESWDAFICHASEDKDEFVRPLVNELKKRDLSIWFDEMTLKIGDSLNRSINKGLSRSRFGVVIISPYFLAKEWPQKELDGLVALEDGTQKKVLPVWHNITVDEIRKNFPMLADRVAISSRHGVEYVADKLEEAIKLLGD